MKNFINKNKNIIMILIASIIFIIINYIYINKKFITISISILYLSIIISFLILKYKKNIIINDLKNEIKNINWPSKKEIKQNTLMITIIILITSIILWIIDSLLTYIISKII